MKQKSVANCSKSKQVTPSEVLLSDNNLPFIHDEVTVPARADYTQNFSDQQIKALQLLISGKTVTEVASELGLARSTIHRWQKHPHVIQEINRLRGEILEATAQRMFNLQAKAVSVLNYHLSRGDLKAALGYFKITNYAEQNKRLDTETNIYKIIRDICDTDAKHMYSSGTPFACDDVFMKSVGRGSFTNLFNYSAERSKQIVKDIKEEPYPTDVQILPENRNNSSVLQDISKFKNNY